MSSELLQRVLRLPPAERLELVEEIWGSLNTLSEPLSPETEQMLKGRLAADQKDPGKVRSWSETKRIATQEFERRRAAKRGT